MNDTNIIEVRNVSKIFPGVVANKDINLEIRQGEVHSIVGENGAGKSTLMNCIFGLISPTAGEIKIRGKLLESASPHNSISFGLGMVHQHFMLIQNFSVLRNIILGLEPGNTLKIDYQKAREEVLEISQLYGLKIDPDALVSDISVPMQQRVEIIKVLWRKAEIIIFDEPTAVLTPQQIDDFCILVAKLKQQGKTTLFISHKLSEVMRISDRITIMRGGEIVATKEVSDTNESDLAYQMVGHSVQLGGGERKTIQSDKPILEIKNLNYSSRKIPKLKNLTLTLMPGEILGVAGVDGNGKDELVHIICGKRKADSGSISFAGKEIKGQSVKQMKEMGVSVVYEDRHRDGLVMNFTVRENLILGYQTEKKYTKWKYFLSLRKINAETQAMQKTFDIRSASLDVLVSTLSGGNQQKVILAREVQADPIMLMTVQPTRGLDMGAIEFVHSRLVEQRNAGRGVLFFSLELDEILQISDRIAVIFNGEIIKILENKNLSKTKVGRYMLGIADEGGAEYIEEK